MRRAERERTDNAFIHQVLDDSGEIYVAMNGDGYPYILPFNFVFHSGSIFIHGAREGQKWQLLQADPRVSFAAAVDIQVEKTTTRYRSVVGTGLAEIVDEAGLKNEILQAIAKKYHAPCKFPISEAKFNFTGMIRINISSMTGKYSHPDERQRPVPHYDR